MFKKKGSSLSEAGQRIQSLIENGKKAYEKEQRAKVLYELFEDLPIILLGSVIPGVYISYAVDISHGVAYGITFLIGYVIGKDVGFKKQK